MNILDIIKKNKVSFSIVTGVVFVFLAAVYLFIFTQKGILFEGSFLKQTKTDAGLVYSGSAYIREISVTVSGDIEKERKAEITYFIQGLKPINYTVEYTGEENIWKQVKLYQQDSLLFEGRYTAESYFCLYDENGEPFLGNLTVSLSNGEGPFTADYEVYEGAVVRTAFGDNTEIRGNLPLFFIAVLLAIFLLFDIRFPLFFFTVRHCLSVYNPEPSDFYLFMQKLTWKITPVIILSLLIASLLVHYS